MTRLSPGDAMGSHIIAGSETPGVFQIVGEQRCYRDGREDFIYFHSPGHTDVPNHNFTGPISCPSDNDQTWPQLVPYNRGWVGHQRVNKIISPVNCPTSAYPSAGDDTDGFTQVEVVTCFDVDGNFLWTREFDATADFGAPTFSGIVSDVYFVTGNQSSRVLTCIDRENFLGNIGAGGSQRWESRYDWVEFDSSGAITSRVEAFRITWDDVGFNAQTHFRPTWATMKTYLSGTGYIVTNLMARMDSVLCLTSDLDYVGEIGSTAATVPGGNTFVGRFAFPSNLTDDRVNIRLTYRPSSGSVNNRIIEIWAIDFDGTSAPSISHTDTYTLVGVASNWMHCQDGWVEITSWNVGDGTKPVEYWHKFGDGTTFATSGVVRPNPENVEAVFTTFDGGNGDARTTTGIASLAHTVIDWYPSTGIDHTGDSRYNGDRYGEQQTGINRFNYVDWNTNTAGYIDYDFQLPDTAIKSFTGPPAYTGYGDFDLDDAAVFMTNPHTNRAFIWQRFYWANLDKYTGAGENHGQSYLDTYVIAQFGVMPHSSDWDPVAPETASVYQLKVKSAVDDQWYFIPSTSDLSMGFEYCDTGSISFSYALDGVNADKVVEDSIAAVYCNGQELLNGRWHIQASEGQDHREDLYSKWYGKSMLGVLDKVLILANPLEGTDKMVTFLNVTPGFMLGALFAQAQARGAMTGITWLFNALNDSSGDPWSSKLISRSYPVGTPYSDVLRSLAQQGILEFRFHLQEIQVYKDRTMGTDFSDTIKLSSGRDYEESPYRRSIEDRAQMVLVTGDDGAAQQVVSVLSPGPFGREEVAISRSGINDIGALGVLGAQYIDINQSSRIEFTRRAISRALGPKHAFDYMVGDFIGEQAGGGFNVMLVRSIVITVDTDGVTAADLVLNDKFYEELLRHQIAIEQLLMGNGIGSITDGSGNTVGGINDDGVIYGQALHVAGDIFVNGQPMLSTLGQHKEDIVSFQGVGGRDLDVNPIGFLEGYSQGIVARANYAAGDFTQTVNSGEAYHLFNIAADLLPGREYSIRIPATYINVTSVSSTNADVKAELRRTVDGSEPSPTNGVPVAASWVHPTHPGDLSIPAVESRYLSFSAGITEARWGFIIRANQCSADLVGASLWIYVVDEGPIVVATGRVIDDKTGATIPPIAKVKSKTYFSNGWATYNGTEIRGAEGAPGDSENHIFQGQSEDGNVHGNQRGLWTFPTTIPTDVGSGSITDIRFEINWQNWYFPQDSVARIHVHAYADGTWPTAAATLPTMTFMKEVEFDQKSGTMRVTVPSSLFADFEAGTYVGFGIGPALITDQHYYGYAENSAMMKVTWTT